MRRLVFACLLIPLAALATGAMHDARFSFTLTALKDGRLLAAGGLGVGLKGLRGVERYDEATASWQEVAPLVGVRQHHAAVCTDGGRMVVAGGKIPNVTMIDTVEIYDPVANTWTPGPPLRTPRTVPLLAPLGSGGVLSVGGYYQKADESLLDALILDPNATAWRPIGSLHVRRSGHTLTRLVDGSFLVAGGYNSARDAAEASSERSRTK